MEQTRQQKRYLKRMLANGQKKGFQDVYLKPAEKEGANPRKQFVKVIKLN